MSKDPLLGMTLDRLQETVKDMGMPAYTAKQIAEWIYGHKAVSIGQITNLSLKNRELLAERYEIGRTRAVERVVSQDGTVKYLFEAGKGRFVETVYIPDGNRATLCVSSQVGCAMGCKFCMTGRQGFTANLTAAQILNQIYSIPESDTLTNIVMMGMGEPLNNSNEVFKALEIITAPYGMAWSPKRVTLSTVGVRNKLREFIERSACHLAISLHSPFPDQRAMWMPAEKAYPIASVIELLKGYDFGHQRRLSFEYIVFKGLNDSLTYGKHLVRLLKGLDCRVNLITFHPVEGVDMEGADPQSMVTLRDYLTAHGLFATIRTSRGEDIYAACGMLSTAKLENN